jgi:hypothetical protein
MRAGKHDETRVRHEAHPRPRAATTGLHWLTGLPLVGAQILVVLLARSSSDKTRLNRLA